jgi:5'-deoxynucleotidase YfbR-like HD superfamily hydrolase
VNLNIAEMLCGDPVRLRYVNRYSTCRVNHKETVAEHSYFVGLYAALIGTWVTRQGIPVAWGLLMMRTMVHDMEEACSGDWPRHFKHSDDDLAANLDRVAKIAITRMSTRLIGENPDSVIISLWEHAKDGTPEGRIVSFADFLSVLSYVSQEHMSGNVFAMEHVQHLDDYFEGFKNAGFDFIRPLVDQAGDFLRSLFADCRRSVFAETAG